MEFIVDGKTYDYNSIKPIKTHNMIYRYLDFINKWGYDKDPGDGVYRERHHIVFVHRDEKTILLEHRAHCIAHWMLTRIFNDYAAAVGFHNVLRTCSGKKGARKEQSKTMHRAKSRFLASVDKPQRETITEDTRDKLRAARKRNNYIFEGNTFGASQCYGYELIDTDGVVHTVEQNLSAFCRENEIDRSHIAKVARGDAKQHKGWVARYINGEQHAK